MFKKIKKAQKFLKYHQLVRAIKSKTTQIANYIVNVSCLFGQTFLKSFFGVNLDILSQQQVLISTQRVSTVKPRLYQCIWLSTGTDFFMKLLAAQLLATESWSISKLKTCSRGPIFPIETIT